MRIDEFKYTPFYATSPLRPFKMEWTKGLKFDILIQFDVTNKTFFYQVRINEFNILFVGSRTNKSLHKLEYHLLKGSDPPFKSPSLPYNWISVI